MFSHGLPGNGKEGHQKMSRSCPLSGKFPLLITLSNIITTLMATYDFLLSVMHVAIVTLSFFGIFLPLAMKFGGP